MKRLLAVLCCASLTGSAFAQHLSKVNIEPERPKDKEVLQITAYANNWAKQSKDPVSAVLYLYDTLCNWHVYDVAMQSSGDTAWKGAFPLPAGSAVAALKFLVGDSVDTNNDTGYFKMITNENGEMIPGVRAGFGLMRSPRYGMGVPGYFKNFTISDTATFFWVSNEVAYHHANGPKLVLPYVESSLAFKKEEGIPDAKKALNFLLTNKKDTTEDSFLKAWVICSKHLKDNARADSIKTVVLNKFPNGALARYEAYKKTVSMNNDMDTKLALAKKFVADFPYSDADKTVNETLGISYYNVYRNLLAISFAKGQSNVLFDYKNTLPFQNIPEAYYKAVEIPYEDWKSVDAKTIYPLADLLYQRIQYYYQHQPAELWYYSPMEWKAYCDQMFANSFRIQARILMEVGKNKDALALAEQVQKGYHYKSSDLNQTQASLYDAVGMSKERDVVLQESVKKNQLTVGMISMMKTGYVKKNGSDKGFDQWMQSLKDPATLELMKADIAKERIERPAKPFSLVDLNGKTVSLASLKGKVVIMDFWATWCAPCKAAMAGMNMAMNKYKNDPGVVFLFVDTQEHIADYKSKVKAFLKEKGYAFTVLFDKGDKMDETYKAFNTMSGIPYKVVIDGGGTIRYENVGYKGSPSGLADEISIMIELAKKEKN